MSQELQKQLGGLLHRLGELDVLVGELEAERARVRASIVSVRTAMGAATPAADTPTVPMRKGKR